MSLHLLRFPSRSTFNGDAWYLFMLNYLNLKYSSVQLSHRYFQSTRKQTKSPSLMQLSAIAIRSTEATDVYGLSRAASWWSGSRSVTPRDRSAPNTYLERIVVRQTWTASWYDASMLGEVLFHRVCFMAPSKLRVITRYSTTGAAQLERIFTEDHLKSTNTHTQSLQEYRKNSHAPIDSGPHNHQQHLFKIHSLLGCQKERAWEFCSFAQGK